jgi:hypothetical protein
VEQAIGPPCRSCARRPDRLLFLRCSVLFPEANGRRVLSMSLGGETTGSPDRLHDLRTVAHLLSLSSEGLP